MKVHLSKAVDDGLIYDLEVSPLQGWFYPPLYKTNILWANQQQYLMSFSYKWASEKRTHYLDLRDSTTYPKERNNDKELTEALFELWQHAGFVVAFNGNKFDNKMASTFFMRHNLVGRNLPSIDPCLIARSRFKLASNSLKNVAKELGVAPKMEVSLGNLTKRIIEDDDPKAWKIFKQYNIQDTVTLEQVWHKIRPHAKSHLNMAMYMGGGLITCPRCGKTDTLVKNGRYSKTATRVYQLWKCQPGRGGCGFAPSERLSQSVQSPTLK